MKKSLDEIAFPEFNESHIKFFEEMVALSQQERLALRPTEETYSVYIKQYVSLVAKEEEYTWLVAAIHAIAQAKELERKYDQPYSPQSQLNNSSDKGFTDKELVQTI